MRQFDETEAKNQFIVLLDLVEHGEDVLITRHGKPLARLVPLEDSAATAPAERTASGYISGQELIDVMQRSPHKEVELVQPSVFFQLRDVEF